VHRRASVPELFVLPDHFGGPVVFEGWKLGHGVEGRGVDELGHEWRRREATIYVTVGGRLLCHWLWVGPCGASSRTCVEYVSDRALLDSLGENEHNTADLCLRIAARRSRKTCSLFGVSGVRWIEHETSSDGAGSPRRLPANSAVEDTRSPATAAPSFRPTRAGRLRQPCNSLLIHVAPPSQTDQC
jgi:hypothetical protein